METRQPAPYPTQRLAHGYYPKGTSGNPSGRPKESVWALIGKKLRDDATKEEVAQAFIGMLVKGKELAWKELLDRQEGKVIERVQLDISVKLDQIPTARLLEACERLGIAAPAELVGEIAPILDAEIVERDEPPEQTELQKMQVVAQPTKNVCNIEERGIREHPEIDAKIPAQVSQKDAGKNDTYQNDTARNDPAAKWETGCEKLPEREANSAEILPPISTPIPPGLPRKFTIVPPGRRR